MKSILTFLLIILMDIQFNYACPCNPTNTLIEMNESFASQFQTATIIPMFLWQPSWSYPIEGLAIGLLISLIWGIERSGFFNGREKWAKGFENQRV